MTPEPAPPPHRLLRRMKAIVGEEHVRSDTADRLVHSYDASAYQGQPALAVAYPRTAQEVAGLVRLARAQGVAVIARGSGTGINGGVLPQKPAIVIALSRMDRVLEVDPHNRLVVVEPGVINQDLKTHLARLGFGFNYVPDPGSQVVSTIGGNVGNNAGGMHCLKYGVTANHVLGVEVVLPDGEIVVLGGPAAGRPGMDLTGLMVGSEGTLGIVTKVWVRILPLQETVVTQLALFPTVQDAAGAVSGIMATGILPAALELLDKKTMDVVDRHVHVGYPEKAGASLIIEMDGLADGMEMELRRVKEVCEANRSIEIQTAQSEAEAGNLWLSRRAAYGAMARYSHTVYVMDVAVPRNLLAEAIGRVVAICDERGVSVVTVAHAGDGNLHPLIPFDGNNEDERARAFDAHFRIMEMCVEMGGSITGEHGVGVEKQNELGLMYHGDDLRMMFAVKETLDPGDLLNPRKVFPVRLFDDRDAAADAARAPGTGSGARAGGAP